MTVFLISQYCCEGDSNLISTLKNYKMYDKFLKDWLSNTLYWFTQFLIILSKFQWYCCYHFLKTKISSERSKLKHSLYDSSGLILPNCFYVFCFFFHTRQIQSRKAVRCKDCELCAKISKHTHKFNFSKSWTLNEELFMTFQAESIIVVTTHYLVSWNLSQHFPNKHV